MTACGCCLDLKFVRKANDSYFYPNIIKQALFLQLLCKERANYVLYSFELYNILCAIIRLPKIKANEIKKSHWSY